MPWPTLNEKIIKSNDNLLLFSLLRGGSPSDCQAAEAAADWDTNPQTRRSHFNLRMKMSFPTRPNLHAGIRAERGRHCEYKKRGYPLILDTPSFLSFPFLSLCPSGSVTHARKKCNKIKNSKLPWQIFFFFMFSTFATFSSYFLLYAMNGKWTSVEKRGGFGGNGEKNTGRGMSKWVTAHRRNGKQWRWVPILRWRTSIQSIPFPHSYTITITHPWWEYIKP